MIATIKKHTGNYYTGHVVETLESYKKMTDLLGTDVVIETIPEREEVCGVCCVVLADDL